MCIAIYKPANKKITRAALYESYKSNRDGCGFAYFRPDIKEVCIQKGFFDFDEFYKAYQDFEDFQCIIHFRIATHKSVNGENCHPWRVNDNLVFIHNGTIAGMTEDDSLSDTGNFNKNILTPLMNDAPDWYLSKQFKWSIENSIASHNKLIFLDAKGNVVIINESKGYWDEGCWFSNKTYHSCAAGFCVVEKTPEEVEAEKKRLAIVESVKQLALKDKPPSSPNSSNITGTQIQNAIQSTGVFHLSASLQDLDVLLEDANKLK